MAGRRSSVCMPCWNGYSSWPRAKLEQASEPKMFGCHSYSTFVDVPCSSYDQVSRPPTLTCKCSCCPAQSCIKMVVCHEVYVQQPVVSCDRDGVTTRHKLTLDSL